MTLRRWGANLPLSARWKLKRVNSRKILKSLWKLITARETEPSLLHIQEVLPELVVVLEAGPICALLGVQTALASFPTHAY
jgi:hypothetical protein